MKSGGELRFGGGILNPLKKDSPYNQVDTAIMNGVSRVVSNTVQLQKEGKRGEKELWIIRKQKE